MNNTDHNKIGIRIIEIILGSTSVIGSLFNIFAFIYFKSIRNFGFECVFYLSISAMMTNISYLMNFETHKVDSSVCVAQGFLMYLFELSQYIWASLISFSVFKNVIDFEKNTKKASNMLRFIFISIGYGIPLILSVICISLDDFGYSGQWCYVKLRCRYCNNNTSIVFFVIAYSIMWSSFAFSLFLIIRIICYLKTHFVNNDERILVEKYISKLRLFPIIQFLPLVPATLARIFEHEGTKINTFALDCVNIILVSILGFLYAIVFGFNTQVREKLSETFLCKLCNKNTNVSKLSIKSNTLRSQASSHSENSESDIIEETDLAGERKASLLV